jgi:two-component sensor histidine kinase
MCPRGGDESGLKASSAMDVHFPDGNVELSRSLMRALRHTGISLIYQDRSLRVVWAQNVPHSWSSRDVTGLADVDFLPAAEAGRVVLAKKAVLKAGEPQNLEIRVTTGDTAYWYEISIDADKSADGKLNGLITTAIDVTDRKRREQTLRALLREVSHRSKNLLAIIQSIATQTGRYSDSIDGFLSRFRGRLQSLSSSQDLVTSSNWRGADLRELVTGQVGRYVADPTRHIRLDGVNPYLNPNAALHIGLALHELAVNSVSYGALSKPEGIVAISAEMGNGQVLNLTWREAVSQRETAIAEKRFGSVALERVVPASLNGSATLTIGSAELEYRLTVPSGSFELE